MRQEEVLDRDNRHMNGLNGGGICRNYVALCCTYADGDGRMEIVRARKCHPPNKLDVTVRRRWPLHPRDQIWALTSGGGVVPLLTNIGCEY